ncbi:hypothetical protein Pcac1_g29359 [Phytophthora cactorum]|nr:hypothetical protein Pcac1_g29359 [Phytophthora cactorum]
MRSSAKQWELCDGCALGKQTRVSYMKSSPNRAKQVLEVIHQRCVGPMQTSTFSGKRYFVTFTDDKVALLRRVPAAEQVRGGR